MIAGVALLVGTLAAVYLVIAGLGRWIEGRWLWDWPLDLIGRERD